MVSWGSLGRLPVIGGLSEQIRGQVMAPVQRLIAVDRMPHAQYTDPPGDPGLFGPGSVTWRVHADPSMLVGGLAALMLQTLHPLAMAGVAEHSDYRDDPYRRLSRTASFVTATTYGSTAVADQMIDMVMRVHTRVVGIAPDGRPYAAGNPELLTWVHMAEVANFLRAHQRFVPFPVRGEAIDRYYHETAVIPERMGAIDVPRSRAAARAYFRDVQADLVAGAQAREAIRFLTTPPLRTVHPALGVAQRVVIQAAVGLLPNWALAMLGLRRPPSVLDWTLVRPAAVALLGTLRLAGGRPLQLAQARQRCRTVPPAAA
jgi:uncharacterized protein (DUF2236 family)